jgi:GDP-L-fucose synthase
MTEVTNSMPFDWSTRNVLVTGGGGVLGTALTATLRDLGPRRLDAPDRAQCDLLDQSSVFQMMERSRPDILFHLAGRVTGVQGNMQFAGAAFYENALMSLNVIEGARRAGVSKIVAAGSVAVYSDRVSLPMREEDIGFGRPHGSEAAYAQGKLGMLAQLEAYEAQYGLPFAYLVCTNLYGPNDRFDERYGHVVPSLISRFHRHVSENSPSLAVWGDGSPTRDFLHAADAARAFVLCAEQGNGAFNTATGASVSIRTLVETISEVSGYRGEVVWDTSKPHGQQTRGYDVRRITALGWRPRLSLHAGIADTYGWFARQSGSARR